MGDMKHIAILTFSLVLLPFLVLADELQLDRAKLELVVEQAGELLADANRKGSPTHAAPYQYYFGLVYGVGTNLLSRKDSPVTKNLQRRYMDLIDKNYTAYTRVEEAYGKAAATGNDTRHVGRHVVSTGSRHRAKRIANAEKLGEKELTKAIQQWESFASQVKRTR